MTEKHTGHPAAGRPQRTLTLEEVALVRSMPLLTLQGALIMGIVDPVPSPSPMSESEGAWVRQHVWPERYQAIEAKYPHGFYRWTHCQRGSCWNCLNNRCDLCIHRQRGGPDVDDNIDWVEDTRGRAVAKFIVRPEGTSCVWWCRCPCAKTGPTATESDAPAEQSRPAPPPDGPAARGPRRGNRLATAVDEAQGSLF
ncbi:DUF6248 family natural product biosynthesis protein [Kitasatospora sp. RB6PN24]|uniref:DUF6248 family natural product biosynthesis protein n=1 Tax=Kitasatospora humi TaxID=2893891 RepID=UPI001E312C63|nr:DUF6248 family natural product biosynthesis protein [Kitasatospora humi]MCC9309925.1 DUF6248 family natural product biosynthesis protein [Kitasatospora humi]